MKYKYLFVVVLTLVLFTSGCSNKEEQLQKAYLEAVDLINHGEYDKAEEKLEACIKKDSSDGRYYYMLGDIYRNQKNYSEAMNNYNLAIEKSPEIKEGYNNIAGLYMIEGKYDEAKKIIDQGLNKFSDYPELIFKKAQLKYFDKDFKACVELMEQIIDNPQYIEGYRFMGMSYLKLGDKNKALEKFDDYLQKSNNVNSKEQVRKLIENF